MNLLPKLNDYLKHLQGNFQSIPQKRKEELKEVVEYIQQRLDTGTTVKLIFICTHNSRRSHISQLFAQAAAYYYELENIQCYSGGTEATAFNPRAVKAMRKAGFEIEQSDNSDNPVYLVKYASGEEPIKTFSKPYADPFNPQNGFAAIMTCSDADEACPLVVGADIRFSLTYRDPKEADSSAEEEQRYDDRCQQIGTEMFYFLSKI